MELRNYLSIIMRRKWVILVTTLVTIAVVLIGLKFYSPSYEATTTLRVATSRTGQVSYEDLLYADRLLKTFAEIANGSSVKEDLVRLYGLTGEPNINAQVLPNTELIRLSVEHSNPVLARDMANTLASLVIRRSQELDNRYNEITITDSAVMPRSPTLSRWIVVAVGVLMGVFGGFGLAFLFDYLDKRLYTNKQIEQVSAAPLLGKIPYVRGRSSIINGSSPQYYKDAFQILRTNLFIQNDHSIPLKTLLITSADPGDGKSTIVANLAFSIAQTGKKVIVIDGDMRMPKLHTIFQIPNQQGLSNVLEGDFPVVDALQTVDVNISVITSGPSPSDPTLLLLSNNIVNLIRELTTMCDYILIDTPSILAVPDAELLAKHVDGMIFVVNRTSTTREAIQELNRKLEDKPARSLGMVINKAELNHGYYYYQRL
jgi:succinoglycan biosynthesis transport protein ExoP